MTRYKIQNLNESPSPADLGRLFSALRGVLGVRRALLHAEATELEIGYHEFREASRDDIAAALSTAGFALAGEV